MSDGFWKLPKVWKWVKLENVARNERKTVAPSATPQSHFNYIELENLSAGQWQEPQENIVRGSKIRSTCVEFKPQQVLYAKLRPYLNKVVLCSRDGVASAEFIPLTPRQELADASYLAWYLRSPEFVAYASRHTTGSRQPRVAQMAFWSVLVPLPQLEEQRRIVAKVEALFDRIREAKRLRAEALTDAESLTDAAREEALSGLGTIKFGMLVASYKNGIYKPKHYYGRGYPSVRMFNIGVGKVNLENAPLLDVTGEELNMYGLEPDDVLINRVNSRELVGKSGLVPPGLGPCTFESKNIRVRMKREIAEPAFVVAALNSKSVKRQILGKQKPAIGQATVNQDDLSELQIPFIPDLEEQRCVVAYLDSVAQQAHGLKHRQEETDAELKRLEQSILDRAFRGEL